MKIKTSAALAVLLACGNSYAAYTLYMYQSGPNVVASGSGTINLTGLNPAGSGGTTQIVRASNATIVTGTSAVLDVYNGMAGPASFGMGAAFNGSSSSGDYLGWNGSINRLVVPTGYVSGAPLTSNATWNANTILGLGLTPGTYTWTWATDKVTLHIGSAPPGLSAPAAIPTLSQWALILMSALVAAFGVNRTMRRSRAH